MYLGDNCLFSARVFINTSPSGEQVVKVIIGERNLCLSNTRAVPRSHSDVGIVFCWCVVSVAHTVKETCTGHACIFLSSLSHNMAAPGMFFLIISMLSHSCYMRTEECHTPEECVSVYLVCVCTIITDFSTSWSLYSQLLGHYSAHLVLKKKGMMITLMALSQISFICIENNFQFASLIVLSLSFLAQCYSEH